MSRALVFVFALMQAQVVISLAMAPTTVCPERCPDDGPDGRCPPECVACPPSSHTATPVTACAAAIPTMRGEPVPTIASLPPTEPEPADIFDVPKPSLA
jgi:hypothetical protein